MKLKEKFIFAFALICIVIISRIIPHYPNFTALGAVALFAGAKFGKQAFSLVLPIAALFLSDLLLNNLVYSQAFPGRFGGFTWLDPESLWVYGGILAITVFAILFLKKQTTGRTILGSVVASTMFFLVTNLGVWASGTLYPMTAEGLIACYTAAIPFFWNTVAGDLFYVAVLFGGFAFATSYFPHLKSVTRDQ